MVKFSYTCIIKIYMVHFFFLLAKGVDQLSSLLRMNVEHVTFKFIVNKKF